MHQHLVKSLNVSVWVKNWVISEWWQPVSLPAVDHFSTAAVTDHLLSLNHFLLLSLPLLLDFYELYELAVEQQLSHFKNNSKIATPEKICIIHSLDQ